MDKLFIIGDFCFSLTYPDSLTPPPNFMKFENSEGFPEYAYAVTLADHLQEPEGELVTEREDIRIYKDGPLEQRLIGVKGREAFYASYREVSETEAHITLVKDEIRDLNIDPIFVSLFALERRLYPKKAMILHCAYTRYRGEAILFSAPSETGKTTQANLWGEYRGSETINGDKSLLQFVDGRWMAQGWPVCGTSEICHDIATPIRAIVMLSQAKENSVRPLTAIQAFSQLYTQITVNTWNREFVRSNMDLIGRLTDEVPVWHLACNISEDAVNCLHRALYPEEAID